MLILAGLLSVLVARAEVVMKMNIPRDAYIQYEPIIVNLALRNTSGQVLVFGSEVEFKGHIEIEITDFLGRPVKGSGAKVNMRGLILRAGVDHHIRLNLSKWIDLTTPGRYKVRLFIAHPLLKNEFESNSCSFEISSGKVFWHKNFGVPQMDSKKSGEILPTRSYKLKALLDKSEIYLFLFIEDEQRIYAIKRIGIQLGNQHAQCEIDSLNRAHIFLPIASQMFQYQVFDWNGEREVNKLYRTTKTIPVLFRNPKNGEVSVVGGEAAQPGIDYADEKLLPGK